jgi:hypothetical protein
MSYRNALPRDDVFGWDDAQSFRLGQYFMAHSLCYRTEVLRERGFRLPDHTFYVDNLIVMGPLRDVHRLYYLDADLYHYFIGRPDQSVHESVMIERLDQQIKVNMMLVDSWPMNAPGSVQRRELVCHHLEIVTAISSFLAIRSGKETNIARKHSLWEYIRRVDPALYRRLRWSLLGILVNLPGYPGRLIPQLVYVVAQRVFGFN